LVYAEWQEAGRQAGPAGRTLVIMTNRTAEETVVAEPPWAVALVWIGFPPAGAAAGWLVNLLVGLVAALPGGPFHRAFELADNIPDPQSWIGSMVLGALAGSALAAQAARDRLTVAVSADRVTLARGGSVRAYERRSVGAVFLDGNRLVLLGPATKELAGEACDLPAGRLRDAFLAHGFAWRDDGDPYRADFRPWTGHEPDLTAAVNALLRARARALAEGERSEAAELGAELATVGIVVRDEKKRQSWRRTGANPFG
jgi:hypothetical protein